MKIATATANELLEKCLQDAKEEFPDDRLDQLAYRAGALSGTIRALVKLRDELQGKDNG